MSQPTAPTRAKHIRPEECGASVLELIAVVTIIGVVTVFAFQRIDSAQRTMRVTNSVREIQSYIEKARVDSVRRHAVSSAQKASVQIVDSTTYTVTMDFAGTGTPQARTITLAQGSNFSTGATALPITISFDWRGRATMVDGNSSALGSSSLTLNDGNNGNSTVLNVSNTGDAGTNSETVTKPNISPTPSTPTIRSNTNNMPAGMTVTQ